jgi:hypothetical protein
VAGLEAAVSASSSSSSSASAIPDRRPGALPAATPLPVVGAAAAALHEGLAADMESLASALRERSQGVSTRLATDLAQLDAVDAGAGSVLSRVAAARADLDAASAAGGVTFARVCALLAGSTLAFVATYALVRAVPPGL